MSCNAGTFYFLLGQRCARDHYNQDPVEKKLEKTSNTSGTDRADGFVLVILANKL